MRGDRRRGEGAEAAGAAAAVAAGAGDASESSLRITVGYGDPARGQVRKLLR